MKYLCVVVFLFVGSVSGQNVKKDTAFTIAEIRFGYGASAFGKGLEEAYNAGNFSASAGFLVTLAAYRKFKNLDHFFVGLKYKSLGAAPSKGINGQEMFFNYWGVAASTRYFPFTKSATNGLFLQADYFFVTQFTQKYRTTASLNFNHQFAIGTGYAIGLGYALPLAKKKNLVTVGIEYEVDERKGEVTGIGDKTFSSSNFGVLVGFVF